MKYNVNVLKWNHVSLFHPKAVSLYLNVKMNTRKQDLPPFAAVGYFLQRAQCMTMSLAFMTK